MLLHKLGGLYLDSDIECLRAGEDMLTGCDVVLQVCLGRFHLPFSAPQARILLVSVLLCTLPFKRWVGGPAGVEHRLASDSLPALAVVRLVGLCGTLSCCHAFKAAMLSCCCCSLPLCVLAPCR